MFTYWGCLQCFQWWSLCQVQWSTPPTHTSRFQILRRNTHTEKKNVSFYSEWCMRRQNKTTKVSGACAVHRQWSCFMTAWILEPIISFLFLLSICSVCFFLPLWWGHAHMQERCCSCTCAMWSTCIHLRQSSSSKHIAVFPYQPRSTLSRGLSAVPSSPPCSGSAAGWCPPPWSASSLWTRPPPPAAARRLQTQWTGWSKRGCCTNSSAGAEQKGVRQEGGRDFKHQNWR